MIDVNKITSTLAKLPDQQLQQYAQMHKNDPYIMALAMSESNRRKELRASGQGAMQEQPKVVDQMVADMAPQQLPEEMGIGQLNAGEMNFAGGGIIAFADGGDVERYQDKGLVYETPYDRMNRLNREAAAAASRGGDSMGGFTPDFAQAELMSGASAMRAQEAQRAKTLAELEQRVAFLTNAGAPQAAAARAQLEAFKASGRSSLPAAATPAVATPTPAAPTAPAPSFTPAVNRGMINQVEQPARKDVAVYSTPAKDKGKGVDKTGRGSPVNKTVEPTTDTTEDKGVSGLDALVKDFTRSMELAQGELKNRRVGLASQLEQTAMEDKAEGEKRRAARGDVFAKKEARLAEREKGIAGLNDKYTGLALLQAGAAMMTTPGNLGMALGKGVQVGSERYIAGIDKINAAKDKFAEARDRLDELRLNRDDMNEKEIRDENRAIRNARLQGQQLFLDGATNDLKISNENQKAIFGVAASALETDKRIASTENTAKLDRDAANARSAAQIKASLNKPDQVLWEQAMAKSGNDAFKALEVFKTAKGDKFDIRPLYAEHLKAFAGKDSLTQPESLATYAARFGATLPR